jgi:hypothetical protein
MSLQTSVRLVRRAHPAHRAHPARRTRHSRPTRHTRRVAIHQVLKAAEQLGLIAKQPQKATRHRRSRRASMNWSQIESRVQVQNAVRLVCTPGPAYFVAAMLAGMAATVLVELWLY